MSLKNCKQRNLSFQGKFSFTKITILFLIIFSVSAIFLRTPVSAAEKLHIKGGELDYSSQQNSAVIKGDVVADYGKYHFHADEVVVEMKEGTKSILSTPQDIKMSPGSLSGCNAENPHYMFKAQKIKITPNNHLKAYHVVYYELNGKLPLFYLPYLYISLDDDRQKLVTEFGYSTRRGWYGKLTYNYELYDRLPGQLYLDYYQKTGEAYGFRQHFIKNDHHQGYVYYYNQQNNIGLYDLFKSHYATQYTYSKKDWEVTSRLDYKTFTDHDLLEGNLDVSHKQEKQDFLLTTNYKNYDFDKDENNKETSTVDLSFGRDLGNDLSVDMSYYLDSENYLKSNKDDEKEMELGLNIDKRFENNFNIGVDLNRKLDYESSADIWEENSGQFDLSYRWADGWKWLADYEYQELKEPEEALKSREDYKTVLSYLYKNFNFETILEREDPVFTEEDRVSFYRLPEFNVEYKPPGSFDYRLQLGNYYEDKSGTKGYRGAAGIDYSRSLQLLPKTVFEIDQNFTARGYKPRSMTITKEEYDPYQLIYNSSLSMKNNLTDRLSIKNSYNVTLYKGESPFHFDQEETAEKVKNEIRYDIKDSMRLNINGGYDIYNQEYLPLKGNLTMWPLAAWTINMGVKYNLNANRFSENLSIASEYQADNIKADTDIEYNMNDNKLHTMENRLEYEIPGQWGWYIENNISYDFAEPADKRLEEANLTIKKSLHCRELKLSYDYLDSEWMLTYNINLFPGDDIAVGQNRDDNFLFKFGLEDELKSE